MPHEDDGEQGLGPDGCQLGALHLCMAIGDDAGRDLGLLQHGQQPLHRRASQALACCFGLLVSSAICGTAAGWKI